MTEENQVPRQKQLKPSILIEKGLLIPMPRIMRMARVLQPFYVKIELDQGEFVATSDISDVYEQGKTRRLAALHYLSSLADEIVWFQEHQERLSHAMLESFSKLRLYLDLV